MLRLIANLKILKAIHNSMRNLLNALLVGLIANLKILKAIHNLRCAPQIYGSVATHREFKNFESNSQRVKGEIEIDSGCDSSRI